MSCLIQIGCCVGDEYIFKLIHNNKINTCIFIDANVSALEKCRENQDDNGIYFTGNLPITLS